MNKSSLIKNSIVIALIDDEEILRDSVNMMLINDKYKILSADGGVAGLKLLKKHVSEIDIVLLDLMMPCMYGIEVLKQIRKDPNLKHLKVIVQTGISDIEEIQKAKALSIQGIIYKPYNKSMIINALNLITS